MTTRDREQIDNAAAGAIDLWDAALASLKEAQS